MSWQREKRWRRFCGNDLRPAWPGVPMSVRQARPITRGKACQRSSGQLSCELRASSACALGGSRIHRFLSANRLPWSFGKARDDRWAWPPTSATLIPGGFASRRRVCTGRTRPNFNVRSLDLGGRLPVCLRPGFTRQPTACWSCRMASHGQPASPNCPPAP